MNMLEYMLGSMIIFIVFVSHTIYKHYSERVFSSITLDTFVAQFIIAVIPGINLLVLAMFLIDIICIIFEKISNVEVCKLK